jgi:hypothetical protein
MKKLHHVSGAVKVAGKLYDYEMESVYKYDADMIQFVCDGAGIGQAFLPEDIASLMQELPDMIIEEQAYRMKKSTRMSLRIQKVDKIEIQKRATEEGKSMTEFILSRALA